MTILKCKMCGGDLNIIEGETVAVCEYCDTKQTVPTADNEKKLTLFARANRLRAACEFDKAAGIYESIVADFPEEAEAYWGMLLCKFGIEYVDDPATGKKIPTCHRSSFESIMDDSDFEQVMENADPIARRVYREEAKTIEELRKNIIEVSSKEEPYDIFICYKETDENGSRTIDSVIAQDVYDALTEKGYRVFFSRITLEDKLGQEYEPYIFAALNSEKVMLAFGTDYEYYNAVWVKNEWSRFLALIAKGEKKTLIPCYKGIDAYDMPKEFRHLQAQDMGKVGATQDLLRGINKIIPKDEPKQAVKETVVVNSGAANVAPLLKRTFIYLEDGDWESADEYAEKVLDQDPENAEAYVGKLMAELKAHKREQLSDYAEPFDERNNYKKAFRFGDDKLKDDLNGYITYIKNTIYNRAVNTMNAAKTETAYREAAEDFKTISGWKDADALAWKSDENAEIFRKDAIYNDAVNAMNNADTEEAYNEASEEFKTIPGWKDADSLAKQCIENAEQSRSDYLRVHRERIAAFHGVVGAGMWHTAGVKPDGTVVAAGFNKFGQCNVSGFKDIIAVSLGRYHTVGLRSDGTVVATKYTGDKKNYNGMCDVFEWKDVVAISVGGLHTVGLKSDGTVVAVGNNENGQCNVNSWSDIVSIAAGDAHTIGLKSDGTVVANEYTGNTRYYHGECDVSKWKDIVAIAAGSSHTVGLKSDGTVVTTEYIGDKKYYDGQCDVSDWKDIIAIAAGSSNTIGLKSDGTVVATKFSRDKMFYKGQCEVFAWKNIIAISAGEDQTVGLKSDGTVVATRHIGDNQYYYGQCDVFWKLLKTESEKEADYKSACQWQKSGEINELKRAADAFMRLKHYKDSAERAAECKRIYKAQEKQEKITGLNNEKNSLQTELSQLKGLFSGARRKKIEARLAEIDKELKNYE